MDVKKAMVDLAPASVVRLFAAPYVAGKGIESGVSKADEIWKAGRLSSTLDLLGEEVFRREDVEATVATYFRMIDAAQRPAATSASRCKPTQLGIHESEAYCLDNLRKVVAHAASAGVRVTVDMEDHDFTDVTLRLFKALRDEFDNVGTVLQSRLFRTKDDILALHAKPCQVRICIGIYKEPKSIALHRQAGDEGQAVRVRAAAARPGPLPRDRHARRAARSSRCIEYLDKRGCPKDAYEFQMLLGVPRAARSSSRSSRAAA